MKNVIIIIGLLLVSSVAFGQQKNKALSMEVDGVCKMCKVRIEKAALKVKGVKSAWWDIPSHQLSLIIDENKTNAMQVKTALVMAGHDTKELKATEKAYNTIHTCCKYREDKTANKETH